MRQIFPPAGGEPDLGPAERDRLAPAALDLLARLYAYPAAGRPWVRANMVSSADGAAWLDGRAGGLSAAADRTVFGVLRSLADVILVGSGTARTERYQPVRPAEVWPQLRAGRPPTPPIAVVSRALELDLSSPLVTGRPGRARTILLTTQEAPASRLEAAAGSADVIVTGPGPVVTAAGAVRALADLGYTAILAEGGPHLLGQIAAEGLLDELCLTYSPVLTGGEAGRILAAGLSIRTGLDLTHVLEDDGHLLCRYLCRPDSPN